MLDELQFRPVTGDLSQDAAQHEDNLLVEAVSLLVQRQRETEAWVAEQIDQADERSGAVERRYAELEARLEGLEAQLERLLRDLETNRADAAGAGGQRLARLREQVADMKSNTDGRPLRSVPSPPSSPEPTGARHAAPLVAAVPTASAPASGVVQPSSGASVWDFFGRTSRARYGALAMFVGLVAILYAGLMELRF
jgi:hypothetical protein